MNPDKIVRFTVSTGEQYNLYFGMRALRGFELERGKSILSIFGTRDVSMIDLSACFKHGLLQNHPRITNEIVDDVMDDIGLAMALDLAADAIAKAYPKPSAGNGIAPNPVIPETLEAR